MEAELFINHQVTSLVNLGSTYLKVEIRAASVLLERLQRKITVQCKEGATETINLPFITKSG